MAEITKRLHSKNVHKHQSTLTPEKKWNILESKTIIIVGVFWRSVGQNRPLQAARNEHVYTYGQLLVEKTHRGLVIAY